MTRLRTAIRQSSEFIASSSSQDLRWRFRPRVPAATTPLRSVATGFGLAWWIFASQALSIWPSRRSGSQRSAIFVPCRDAMPIRRPRRVRLTADETGSFSARVELRSCSSGPRALRRRHANVYAEVAGCGSSSDAFHHVIPSPDPAPAAAAMRRALADARIDPADVDHVNAHATSTPVGDAAEAAVIRLVLGDCAGRIPVTSTKSLTGHMLTAAGAFEALACLTAMRHQAIPPTINLDEPDVDLCVVANEARPHRVRVAVSNSFGFGGSNTSLVLRVV